MNHLILAAIAGVAFLAAGLFLILFAGAWGWVYGTELAARHTGDAAQPGEEW